MLVVPSDHEISTERQFWETIENGAAAADDGQAGGVRHQAQPAGDRLRLHRGLAAGDGPVLDVSRFVEKPDLETAQELSGGRQFLLEHRHLPVPRQRHARRIRGVQPGDLDGDARRPSRRRQRGLGPLPAGRPLCGDPVDLDRLCDHGAGAAASPWSRPASAGTISARGSRCSTSARPTRPATSSSATSWRSTARTRTCAATAGCSRRSA